MPKRDSPCVDCGKNTRGVRCNSCWGLSARGENSPFWKGGPAAKRARLSEKNHTQWLAYSRAYYAEHRREILLELSKTMYAGPRNSYARRKLMPGATFEVVDFIAIAERDAGICGICHEPIGDSRLSFDHIIPLTKGGDHTPANLQLAHNSCNASKKARIL